MSNADERDFDEEAANEALLREDGELGDYEIVLPAAPREDADLTADAMKALEDRILAAVPDGQRDEVQDLISVLLDLAPGQALSPEATRDAARNVLEADRQDRAPRRTLTDAEINTYARFYPHHEATDESDITSHPCVAIGGDENDDGAVQAYVYAEGGGVVVSLHFDTAGPTEDDGSGPWAYYGPDGAIPVRVIGGNGEPVYVADADTPDLSDPLIADAHGSLRWLAEVTAPDDIDHEAVIAVAHSLGTALRSLLAITGRPVSGTKGGYGPEGDPEVQGGSE